ncbi:MAG: hypothetical protein EOP83_15980 [Verrucomicrobiaceae bacterium]|nr:MAG: hypothetical protein EOP83_15980 [Verrucomicrobiaceae bacterium]
MDEQTRLRIKSEDTAFLSNPAEWPQNGMVCMKTPDHDGQQFGLYFAVEPLKVAVTDLMSGRITEVIEYLSLDALLDAWMVD